jgi:hypothetical protein
MDYDACIVGNTIPQCDTESNLINGIYQLPHDALYASFSLQNNW